MDKELSNLYRLFMQNGKVTTDSRTIEKGSIFFALKGENFNGNVFAKSALEKGAIAAVIDNPDYYAEGCVVVKDVLKSLQEFANYHRRQLVNTKVIGITGTNGKTTTKELINAVLSKKYKVFATKGNLNNHIGVPLTLLSLKSDIQFAIVEMGASHLGDIWELVSIAEPDYGIITNIGRAHLGGFGSFEGVVSTKSELYKYLSEKGGVVFFNQENPVLSQLSEKFEFGENAIRYDSICSNVEIVKKSQSPFLNLKLSIDTKKEIEINTSLVGDYNKENVLAAVTIGRYFDVDVNDIKNAVEKYVPTNSRSQFLKTAHNTVIVDAYNANPSSMEFSIRNFANVDGVNKVAILGEMLELGEYSEKEHSRVVQFLEDMGISNAILIGKSFSGLQNRFMFFINVDECFKYLSKSPMRNSLILLKGSRGVKLEKLMPLL
ncbi:MAG: UDP-N-acetylmuramoyl-tripeptide--D-alanyl-D-alanine ligase [Bacteroidales bacterium]|nr:UDP-N-acetylmuramoyl-tripeptide--D-alanyl-D-alanine ligase [Bacteroidales bacterium]HRX31493.1 UDP-N-acetylmuramoyl-tripeptide--D-alanyl-D-alanine ligase [Tenuifilaceae bacterium]